MKIQPTKQPWPQHIRDLENGNVANVRAFSQEKNCTEITKSQWSIHSLGSQHGTTTSPDYLLEKYSLFASNATNPRVPQKIKFDESLENLNNKYIGKKIDFHGHIGIIEDIPNDNIAWVHFEGEPLGSTRGIRLSDILDKERVLHNDLGLVTYEQNPADNLAKRYNSGKVRYTLIPLEAEEAEARVWMKGAEKYGENNWEKGLPFKSVLDSLLRHVKALQRGELIDPETGEPHAAHIRCNAGMLITFAKTHPELNNLPKSDTK